MRTRRHIAVVMMAVLLMVSWTAEASARNRDRKKKKKEEPQEQVQHIRIAVDMAELRDSIAADCNRIDEEFYDSLKIDAFRTRWQLADRIDAITGLGHGHPRSYMGDLAVTLAKEHLGKPYKWAANGPDIFDCSGFTKYIYREIGINIPRYSGDQYRDGKKIDIPGDLREGDLVFFGTKRQWHTVGHVGIVVSVDRQRGTFSFIHASSSGGVRISPISEVYFQRRYIGGARYIPDNK